MVYHTHMHKNTVRDLREQAALSQEELARRARVTRMYVVRAEQLMYPYLAPGLSRALADISRDVNVNPLTPKELEEDYMLTREEHLRNTAKIFDHKISNQLAKQAKSFEEFRVKLFDYYDLPTSLIKFCQYTGCAPSSVAAYEKRSRRGKKEGLPPVDIVGACIQILHVRVDNMLHWRSL